MTNIIRWTAVTLWLSRLRNQQSTPAQPAQVQPEQRTRGVRGQVVVDYFNNQSKSTAEDWEEFHRDLMETRESSKQ
jgi:hypothetical protein